MNEETLKLLNELTERYGLVYSNFQNSNEFFALLFIAMMKDHNKLLTKINTTILNPRMLMKPDGSIEPLLNDSSAKPGVYKLNLSAKQVNDNTDEAGVFRVPPHGAIRTPTKDLFEIIVEEEGNNPSCDADTMRKLEGFHSPWPKDERAR